MAVRLTDAAVRAAKPGGAARDLFDLGEPGLTLRVTPAGRKSWALRIRWQGRQRRVHLGDYPATTLAEARDLAAKARKFAQRGENPEHAVRPPRVGTTVAEELARWAETKAGNRSAAMERRRMELHVIPALGDRLVGEVARADVAGLLHDLVHKRGLTAEANRTHTSLRGFFAWTVEMGLRPDDPTANLRRPVKVEASAAQLREERVPLLDTGELARLHAAAPALPSTVLGDLVRCMLLVPLRREEWTGLAWSEVWKDYTEDGWRGAALVIPAARMKGKRPAVVPLPEQAVAVIEGRRQLTGEGPCVFAVPGRKEPFAGWKRGAETLRKALGERDDWSPHTIRKSVATALVRDLGADEMLVGRILQHSPRAALGITHTYQRSRRLREQAELLQRWAELLDGMAAGVRRGEVVVLRAAGLGNVVPLEGGR